MRAVFKKGGRDVDPSLSLLGRRKPFRRYTPSGTPVFDPYTSFALSESSKNRISDPREQWVEKSRLPSFSEFLGGNVQRANPTNSPGGCRLCCPIDREEDSSAQKSRLIVSMYTKVEKYGLVFRERKLTAAAYQPPEETTVDAPTFFDTALDGVTRISKSSRLVVPGVDSGTVLA